VVETREIVELQDNLIRMILVYRTKGVGHRDKRLRAT
jgi:hypothetical protein